MADIVTSKTWVDGEKGVTAAKMNQIISGSVIQPAFYTAKPSSPTLDPTDVLLELKNTNAYAQITGSQLINSVAASVSSTRPRSFNAIGNPSFEVDQRNAGTAVAMTPPVTGWVDRWNTSLAGTMRASSQQIAANVVLPSSNFLVTQNILRTTITTLKASLVATDYLAIQQAIEGPILRELVNDVHSVSILARSSIANLSFGLYLQDKATAHSLTKLCTLGAANTWTLLTYPNLPLWTASGTWGLTAGQVGYLLGICLAAGTTYTAAANDTWQNANVLGALGQSNFAAGPISSTFDLAFCQHEPGSACSTLIDLPFNLNLDACQRYFSKTYSYAVKPGTSDITGSNATFWAATATSAFGYGSFKKTMAKAPAVTIYNPASGAVNSAYNTATAAAIAVTGAGNIGDSGFLGMAGTGFASQNMAVHYTADTGW